MMIWIGIGAALFAVLLTTFMIMLATRYKRCPSNSIMVIYGRVGTGNNARCIHGGAAFIIPLIQDYAYLSLEPIQIEVPLRDALSMENIRVNVPSVFSVGIGTDPVVMNNAAVRLLGLSQQQIKKNAEDIIFGQLRQVIASMRIEEINRDRDNFLSKIQQSLEPELRKIGLVLLNVNITDITDNSGYIDAIGRRAAAEAVEQARADVAEQEKYGEMRVAENVREKEVAVAEANKNQSIGIKAAEQEQAVRIAELDRQQRVGEQRAVYESETQVKESEREMRISVANANAVAIEGENMSKAKIADSEASLKIREADAYQAAQTRSEQAKAAVMEAKNLAMAKAALADAERIEAERRAELEAPAKARKAQTIVDSEAEAEKLNIEAQGEAKAIFAKMEAEARGQFEMLRQKAEGMRMIVEASGGANEAFQLLILEHLDKLAEESSRAISNIKFDKIVVWENGSNGSGNGNGKNSTANFLSGMANVLPPMLHTMKDIGGVQVPEFIAKLIEDQAAAGEKPDAAGAKQADKDKNPKVD